MILNTVLMLNLSTYNLCIHTVNPDQKPNPEALNCLKVNVGRSSTPTPKGVFEVEKIYLNASLVFEGTNLGSSIIGNTMITLKNQNFSIHGWKAGDKIIGENISHSCIRVNTQQLRDLIQNYYFNKIIIN